MVNVEGIKLKNKDLPASIRKPWQPVAPVTGLPGTAKVFPAIEPGKLHELRSSSSFGYLLEDTPSTFSGLRHGIPLLLAAVTRQSSD
jgi:hypothetical protein